MELKSGDGKHPPIELMPLDRPFEPWSKLRKSRKTDSSRWLDLPKTVLSQILSLMEGFEFHREWSQVHSHFRDAAQNVHSWPKSICIKGERTDDKSIVTSWGNIKATHLVTTMDRLAKVPIHSLQVEPYEPSSACMTLIQTFDFKSLQELDVKTALPVITFRLQKMETPVLSKLMIELTSETIQEWQFVSPLFTSSLTVLSLAIHFNFPRDEFDSLPDRKLFSLPCLKHVYLYANQTTSFIDWSSCSQLESLETHGTCDLPKGNQVPLLTRMDLVTDSDVHYLIPFFQSFRDHRHLKTVHVRENTVHPKSMNPIPACVFCHELTNIPTLTDVSIRNYPVPTRDSIQFQNLKQLQKLTCYNLQQFTTTRFPESLVALYFYNNADISTQELVKIFAEASQSCPHLHSLTFAAHFNNNKGNSKPFLQLLNQDDFITALFSFKKLTSCHLILSHWITSNGILSPVYPHQCDLHSLLDLQLTLHACKDASFIDVLFQYDFPRLKTFDLEVHTTMSMDLYRWTRKLITEITEEERKHQKTTEVSILLSIEHALFQSAKHLSKLEHFQWKSSSLNELKSCLSTSDGKIWKSAFPRLKELNLNQVSYTFDEKKCY